MRLALIRHPAPQVASGICYGSTDLDLPLDGCTPVLAELRRPLRSFAADTVIYSSPLRRARSLALQLAAQRQANGVEIDTDLQEMHFGAWEMRAWDSIARSEIDAWAHDLLHYQVGGGETVLQMTHRVLAFLQRLQQQNRTAAIVVCHAGTMRILQAWQAQNCAAEIALRAAQSQNHYAYGECCVLEF